MCFRNSETAAPTSEPQQTAPQQPETTPDITIDDFMKCEIVVGIIRQASFVKKSKKLVCFQVQIEPEDKPESYRQILSGIRQHYPSIASSEDLEALSGLFLGQQVHFSYCGLVHFFPPKSNQSQKIGLFFENDHSKRTLSKPNLYLQQRVYELVK